jgi:hypothetical protein
MVHESEGERLADAIAASLIGPLLSGVTDNHCDTFTIEGNAVE